MSDTGFGFPVLLFEDPVEAKEHNVEADESSAPVLVADYDRFVRASDHSCDKSHEQRLDIATYGLAAELGSVISAVKKRLLGEGGSEEWNAANDEILEELGDVLWYGFSLSHHANEDAPISIFAHDIEKLRREVGASDERAREIQRVLAPEERAEFLRAAEEFPRLGAGLTFDDYQLLAIRTARTRDRTLVEVCLAVLWQLTAEIFRRKLPKIELRLNNALAARPINDLLGEIAWHVSALANTYGLTLSQVARHNMEKVAYRLDRTCPTPLHDEDFEERFPRQMEIAFVTVSNGRSRMYYNGRQLGDELTDNAYDDDGYRFHDIMHLANVAKVGWSPVVRGLLGLKRKSNRATDAVEDGARAKIVEEALIKAIHSEGTKLAGLRGPQPQNVPVRLFISPRDLTFRFLNFIHNFVRGLEVEKNRSWEWEEAIMEGHDIFFKLRCEGQGTVTLDLNARTIAFKPQVFVDLDGRLVGLGSASIPGAGGEARLQVQKLAILNGLGLDAANADALEAEELRPGCLSVKASGKVREAMWAKAIVSFRTTVTSVAGGQLHATAIALADG